MCKKILYLFIKVNGIVFILLICMIVVAPVIIYKTIDFFLGDAMSRWIKEAWEANLDE